MKVFIDNKLIENCDIGPPDTNYGCHSKDPNMNKFIYEYQLSKKEFMAKIADCFERFRLGEISDSYDDEDITVFPELFEFRDLGFPKLEILIEKYQKLLEKLLIYWEYDISHSLSEFEYRNQIRIFSVNSINSINFYKYQIVINGFAYKIDLITK